MKPTNECFQHCVHDGGDQVGAFCGKCGFSGFSVEWAFVECNAKPCSVDSIGCCKGSHINDGVAVAKALVEAGVLA